MEGTKLHTATMKEITCYLFILRLSTQSLSADVLASIQHFPSIIRSRTSQIPTSSLPYQQRGLEGSLNEENGLGQSRHHSGNHIMSIDTHRG
jgi:hypothetical protein